MTERKYLPTLSDLIDRLSIVQLKAIFNPAKREDYQAEIALIEHDIDILLGEDSNGHRPQVSSEVIRASMILMLSNREIWRNEAAVRDGTGGGDLKFTHSLNGRRNEAKNRIAKWTGERLDWKVDCLAADLPEEFGNWRIWDDGE